MNCQDPGFPAN